MESRAYSRVDAPAYAREGSGEVWPKLREGGNGAAPPIARRVPVDCLSSRRGLVGLFADGTRAAALLSADTVH